MLVILQEIYKLCQGLIAQYVAAVRAEERRELVSGGCLWQKTESWKMARRVAW